MFESIRKRVSNIIYSSANNAISLPNQFLRYGSKIMKPDWTQVVMSDKDHYTGYFYAAIRKRSNSTARIASEKVKTQSDQEGFVHPYLTLIEESTLFSEYQFWFDISTYLDLEGVYYLMVLRNTDGEKVGNIQEFKLLNPYHITKVYNSDKTEVAGYVEARDGLVRRIPPEMIIEIKELNPFDERENYAMTDAAKESQFTMKTASDYTRHTLKHNINAPGIMSTGVILGDEDFKNFTERVKNHTKGEPVFGNGDGAITWESMQNELPKSALQEVNEINRDSLFSIAGVSKTIMGIEQSGTTRETAKVQKDLMVESEVLPRIQKVLDALNLDYKTNYTRQFESNKAKLYVENPLTVDQESNIKAVQVKQDTADLYNDLIEKGYDSELAAQYVNGDIGVEELGEPDPPPPTEPDIITEAVVLEEKPAIENKSVFMKHDCKEHAHNQTEINEEEQGLVKEQEGALQNAVINVEQQIVSRALNRLDKVVNQAEPQKEFIGKRAYNRIVNELELILTQFYGVIINLEGGKVINKRSGQYALPATFKLDRITKNYIKDTALQVSVSHIDTVISDILVTAQEEALKGSSLKEIERSILNKYNETISETRAKTISRTETNRAFTRAQYDADRQFIDQNDFQGRAFKQWRTRSGDPCPFCLELESRPPIPFDKNFVDLGSTLTVDGKKLPVNFQALEAGNAHPNCACIYELIIITDNAVQTVQQDLKKEKKEKQKLQEESEQIDDLLKQIDEVL